MAEIDGGQLGVMVAVCTLAGEAGGMRNVVKVSVVRPTAGDGAGTAEGDEHGSWSEREALHAPELGAGRGRSGAPTPTGCLTKRQFKISARKRKVLDMVARQSTKARYGQVADDLTCAQSAPPTGATTVETTIGAGVPRASSVLANVADVATTVAVDALNGGSVTTVNVGMVTAVVVPLASSLYRGSLEVGGSHSLLVVIVDDDVVVSSTSDASRSATLARTIDPMLDPTGSSTPRALLRGMMPPLLLPMALNNQPTLLGLLTFPFDVDPFLLPNWEVTNTPASAVA
ncbi:hypothetical protein GUJ93_ZPchr0010g9319 [Zizania palustris]|uniref:Uncharacterized protein n=1 Tax=Zizania palustris TaxID=103762 RepID=A0A8J5WF65_ZIZPA|nr:hypothetical protein GUJ93_ZPchr0010g9319 [Zizania palustris]